MARAVGLPSSRKAHPPSRWPPRCARFATSSGRCATAIRDWRPPSSTSSIARSRTDRCVKSASRCARSRVARAAHNHSASTWRRTSPPPIRPARIAPASSKPAAEQIRPAPATEQSRRHAHMTDTNRTVPLLLLGLLAAPLGCSSGGERQHRRHPEPGRQAVRLRRRVGRLRRGVHVPAVELRPHSHHPGRAGTRNHSGRHRCAVATPDRSERRVSGRRDGRSVQDRLPHRSVRRCSLPGTRRASRIQPDPVWSASQRILRRVVRASNALLRPRRIHGRGRWRSGQWCAAVYIQLRAGRGRRFQRRATERAVHGAEQFSRRWVFGSTHRLRQVLLVHRLGSARAPRRHAPRRRR